MHGMWGFRLVLCAGGIDCVVDDSVKTLERIAEEAVVRLGHLPRELLIISERRSHRIIDTYGFLDMGSGVKNHASAGASDMLVSRADYFICKGHVIAPDRL